MSKALDYVLSGPILYKRIVINDIKNNLKKHL